MSYSVSSVVSLDSCIYLCYLFVRRPTNPASSCPVAQPASDQALAAPVEVAQVCLSPPRQPHITPSVRRTLKHVYDAFPCMNARL